MREEDFLVQFIFCGLKNMNNGIDSDSIWHFSIEDFETVMDRIEQHNILMLGIECWSHKKIRTVKYADSYEYVDKWHRKAVAELHRSNAFPCTFAATYEIPDVLLYMVNKSCAE